MLAVNFFPVPGHGLIGMLAVNFFPEPGQGLIGIELAAQVVTANKNAEAKTEILRALERIEIDSSSS